MACGEIFVGGMYRLAAISWSRQGLTSLASVDPSQVGHLGGFARVQEKMMGMSFSYCERVIEG